MGPPKLRALDRSSGVGAFLRWPGGKRWLLRAGICVPTLDDQATYWEPFLGAGSLFFALQPRRAVLSDINRELVVTYRGLRTRPGYVINELKRLPNDRMTFDRIKAWEPSRQHDRAVRFIYLNRTAFSGLYRENAAGEFNVPFGGADRRVCQEQVLKDAAACLKGATLRTADFEDIKQEVCAGDLVYLDPPYIVGHRNNGFIRYNSKLFDWQQQLTLAALAEALAASGAHVLVSAADHIDVLRLYPSFWCSHLSRKDQVSANPAGRGSTTEVLLASYPGATTECSRVRSRSL